MQISERALLQRINRKLAHDYERVGKLRSGNTAYEHVDYYHNMQLSAFDDLEDFARQCGVLHKSEALQPEDRIIKARQTPRLDFVGSTASDLGF